ncbi:MYOM3 [Branchiostoma lanceolatum]|uniref:MYOM3 protein n=1 Tax=Branchiostoma lanceolatum TaxID=7740 RepID=A0A8K0EM81_BRALA|nr:MYOM3 [Branchiostoma lanceolatum]
MSLFFQYDYGANVLNSPRYDHRRMPMRYEKMDPSMTARALLSDAGPNYFRRTPRAAFKPSYDAPRPRRFDPSKYGDDDFDRFSVGLRTPPRTPPRSRRYSESEDFDSTPVRLGRRGSFSGSLSYEQEEKFNDILDPESFGIPRRPWSYRRRHEEKKVYMPKGKPPMFTTGLRTITVGKGVTARFTCSVRGDPVPRIKWYRDDEIITHDGFKYRIYDVCGVMTLEVRHANVRDTGYYTCMAINDSGTRTTVGRLYVSEKIGEQLEKAMDEEIAARKKAVAAAVASAVWGEGEDAIAAIRNTLHAASQDKAIPEGPLFGPARERQELEMGDDRFGERAEVGRAGDVQLYDREEKEAKGGPGRKFKGEISADAYEDYSGAGRKFKERPEKWDVQALKEEYAGPGRKFKGDISADAYEDYSGTGRKFKERPEKWDVQATKEEYAGPGRKFKGDISADAYEDYSGSGRKFKERPEKWDVQATKEEYAGPGRKFKGDISSDSYEDYTGPGRKFKESQHASMPPKASQPASMTPKAQPASMTPKAKPASMAPAKAPQKEVEGPGRKFKGEMSADAYADYQGPGRKFKEPEKKVEPKAPPPPPAPPATAPAGKATPFAAAKKTNPYLKLSQTRVEAKVGEKVEFACFATGDPIPGVEWRKGSSILPSSGRYDLYEDDDEIVYFVIRKVVAKDAGIYTCHTSNTKGTVTGDVELVVRS